MCSGNCAEQEESLASARTINLVLWVCTIIQTSVLVTISVYYIYKRKKSERQTGETGEINSLTESSIMMNSAQTPSPVEEATA
ncbi:hypothetical protein V1264_017444 [Littorina saxatilis]|uniref:Uncharacterized protein n=1 Tax=Littorina saxatilis TaxID=31220 RepID=A0AAN9BIB7_9CAEN